MRSAPTFPRVPASRAASIAWTCGTLLALALPAYATVVANLDQRTLGVNRLALPLTNAGSFASHHLLDGGTAAPGLEFPRGSGRFVAFAGGVWLVGRDGPSLAEAIVEYGTEFRPGPFQAIAGPIPPGAFPVHAISRADTSGTADWMAYAVPYGAPLDSTGARPGHLGDQTLWTVCTDQGVTESQRGGGTRGPLGLELQTTAWGFDRGLALRDVAFLRFRLVNHRGLPIDSAYVGVWYDADIRSADSPAASDTALDMAYVYRTTDDTQYGAAGPATGIVLLQGPRDAGVWLRPGAIVGYANGADPTGPEQYANALHGLFPWGAPMIDPTTSSPARFFAPGDPVTGTGWLEPGVIHPKVVVAMGPFTFAAGDTQDVIAAIVVGQGANRLASIAALRANAREARAAFADDFRSLPPPTPEPRRALSAWPTPATGEVRFALHVPAGGAAVRIELYDLLGRRVRTLDAGALDPGVRTVTWDGRRDDGTAARTGVYLARATVGGEERSGRIVLVR